MTDSWWARRLGITPQQPTSGPPSNGGGLPQKAVRWQEPQYPPTGPRQEVLEDRSEDDDTYIRVRHQGYDTKAPSGLGQSGKCPSCRGSNYFRRRWSGFEAAPLCTDCGYNGDYFTQSGTLLNGVGMKSAGPTHSARSDNPRGDSNFSVDPSVPNDFNWSAVR
jgi:hypothetical protein